MIYKHKYVLPAFTYITEISVRQVQVEEPMNVNTKDKGAQRKQYRYNITGSSLKETHTYKIEGNAQDFKNY